MVNFVHAVAYHFFLALHAEFTQPGTGLFAKPCIYGAGAGAGVAVWNSFPFGIGNGMGLMTATGIGI